MRILVLSVGKLDRTMFAPAAAEYEKRLKRYCDFSTLALAEGPQARNDGEIARCLQEEGVRILSHIRPDDFVVTLCIDGAQCDSMALARKIGRHRDLDGRPLVFIIGSSHGLSNAVLQRANARLSMSKMTFPHQLARVMLCEQLYRAFTILQGQTYHK